MRQIFEYQTNAGITVQGIYVDSIEAQGTDTAYVFHRLTPEGKSRQSPLVDVVRGSRLCTMRPVRAIREDDL